MRETWLDNSSKVINTQYNKGLICYKNAIVSDSQIGSGVTIGDDTTVARCTIGNNVAINRRSYINDSIIGDYSYSGSNTTINFTSIGKYCSLARNVDIGGFDHDYHKVTTMPLFRFTQLSAGTNPQVDDDDGELCIVGNDVWIAAGAQILHKVHIGDGAVIGGGAVVTKDVPPYAIAVGVPAKIIKYRFNEDIIKTLMEIQWWNWPEEIIMKNMHWMIQADVDYNVLEKMKEISNSLLNK